MDEGSIFGRSRNLPRQLSAVEGREFRLVGRRIDPHCCQAENVATHADGSYPVVRESCRIGCGVSREKIRRPFAHARDCSDLRCPIKVDALGHTVSRPIKVDEPGNEPLGKVFGNGLGRFGCVGGDGSGYHHHSTGECDDGGRNSSDSSHCHVGSFEVGGHTSLSLRASSWGQGTMVV